MSRTALSHQTLVSPRDFSSTWSRPAPKHAAREWALLLLPLTAVAVPFVAFVGWAALRALR